MIEIAEALELIRTHSRPLEWEQIALARSVGRFLADPIMADVDSPPHDKSLMDGFAVIAADIAHTRESAGSRPAWKILETIKAGMVPRQLVTPGTCARIMTGAPMPAGADAVIMIELADMNEIATEVSFQVDKLQAGQHVMRRAQAMRCGDLLYQPGHRIRPADIGLLAEVGQFQLRVRKLPRLAVLATGDELVPPQQVPGPGQIRNSNGPMVEQLAAPWSEEVLDLGVARDEIADLTGKIQQGLRADVLVLTGGVSEGLVDLVPRALQQSGVEPVFHKVSIKPGKPIWFGVAAKAEHRCFVFGLPGNPVSSLVCFRVFVQPCLEQLAGGIAVVPKMEAAELAADHQVRGPRPTYWPARLTAQATAMRRVEALAWQGSSDLRCLAEANAFIFFPPREASYRRGEIVSVLPLA